MTQDSMLGSHTCNSEGESNSVNIKFKTKQKLVVTMGAAVTGEGRKGASMLLMFCFLSGCCMSVSNS